MGSYTKYLASKFEVFLSHWDHGASPCLLYCCHDTFPLPPAAQGHRGAYWGGGGGGLKIISFYSPPPPPPPPLSMPLLHDTLVTPKSMLTILTNISHLTVHQHASINPPSFVCRSPLARHVSIQGDNNKGSFLNGTQCPCMLSVQLSQSWYCTMGITSANGGAKLGLSKSNSVACGPLQWCPEP